MTFFGRLIRSWRRKRVAAPAPEPWSSDFWVVIYHEPQWMRRTADPLRWDKYICIHEHVSGDGRCGRAADKPWSLPHKSVHVREWWNR